MPIAIVTGSGGLIGSESVRHFVERGFDVDRDRERHARALLRARGLDAPHAPSALEDGSGRVPLASSSTSATPRASSASSREHAGDARARHPHRRAALARLGRAGPADRLRRQRQRHAQPARGHARARARRDVHLHARRTRSTATGRTTCRSRSIETRLELPEDHDYYGGIATSMSIDRSHALAVRRLEGGGRPAGAGVRALLRHADRLLPRRLPDRPGRTPARSCTASSPT